MQYKYQIRAKKVGNQTFTSINSATEWPTALKRAHEALATGKYEEVSIERSSIVKVLKHEIQKN